MKNKKVCWLSAFKNVVPSDYENWLESLALQGWQIDKIGQWSSVYMTFRKGDSKKYRFVYDMQSAPKKDYKTTYELFGWESVGQMASAYIWRKEYASERPESFSDTESLEKRNKRFVGAVSVSFIMFLLIALVTTVLFIVFFNRLDTEDIVQFILGIILSYIFSVYLGSVMKKIYKNKLR